LKRSLLVVLAVIFMIGLAYVPRASAAVQGQIILDIGTQSWESVMVFRPSVIHTGSQYMMWYTGESEDGTDSIGLATSSDGITWTRYANNPVLTVGGLLDWDYNSVEEAWVIFDEGQYKMWYGGQVYNPDGSCCSSWAIGYASSPDGIQWTKYSGNPILTPGESGSFDDRYLFRPVVFKIGSTYTMYYRGQPQVGRRDNGIATSTDGVHWTKTGKLSIQPAPWNNFSYAVGGVTKIGDLYVMGYNGNPLPTEPRFETGVATSTDGVDWTPYAGNPVVTYGSSGWDSGGGVTDPVVLAVGSEYFVYFTGHEVAGQNPPMRIGLARLPASEYPIPEYPSGQVSTMIYLGIASTCLTMIWLRRRRSKRT